jgi:hypothetical protein
MMSVLLFGNVFTKTERWRMKKLVARFGKADGARGQKSEVRGQTGVSRL